MSHRRKQKNAKKLEPSLNDVVSVEERPIGEFPWGEFLTGKCERCGGQMEKIPGSQDGQSFGIYCPACWKRVNG